MTLRQALSWKPWFYGVLLPALRRLEPAWADAVLAALGRLVLALDPGRRRQIDRQIARARTLLEADWDPRQTRRDLAAGILRSLARDYLIDDEKPGLTPAPAAAAAAAVGVAEPPPPGLASRFDVSGLDSVAPLFERGEGLILLGAHLGAHLVGLHWMIRQGWPLRLLVQRPRHVSPTLQLWFDEQSRPGTRIPQAALFLRRYLEPAESVQRVLLARDAIRQGLALYINGDVPWPIPSARPSRFLGAVRPFLTLWADLAVQTAAPVVPLICTHRPGGRYHLAFGEPFHVTAGTQADHLATYLERLEQTIAQHPADAVPYLTWPTYTTPDRTAQHPAILTPRPAGHSSPMHAKLAPATEKSLPGKS